VPSIIEGKNDFGGDDLILSVVRHHLEDELAFSYRNIRSHIILHLMTGEATLVGEALRVTITFCSRLDNLV
jgi:hypothetical protein